MAQLEAVRNNGGTVTLESEALDGFKAQLRGELLTAESSNYDEVRLIWNGMHDKRPALIVRCTGVADVIAAVNFARENSLLVAVRGGGHNVAGTASCDGGIMIDLSLLTGVFVDAQAKTARVQGGATWGDVDRETQVFGLATPGGVVSTTGVAGLTLGGGIGYLRRKHGLTIDNVLAVQMVTANGEVVNASANENADLFWGIRGGGGNFGIVTSFEFQLHPVGPMVALCSPLYPAEEAKELLPKWRDLMNNAPDEFSCSAGFWTIPPIPDFPTEIHGRRFLILDGVYAGPVEAGLEFIQPLRELSTPLIDFSGPAPWVGVQSASDAITPKGGRLYYFKSRHIGELTEAALETLVPRAINPPAPYILVILWHYGGAMRRVAADETAFMGRDASFLFSVDSIWDDPADSESVIAYARDFLEAMKPYAHGGSYINFVGFGEEGEALVKDAYGAHYARLVTLKNKYDPGNLFRLNQNIKPSA